MQKRKHLVWFKKTTVKHTLDFVPAAIFSQLFDLVKPIACLESAGIDETAFPPLKLLFS